MKKKFPLRVVVAPLDWGLGHATRCIPLIKSLLDAGCSVYVACNSTAQSLFLQEFSNLHILPLQGYNIRYTSSKRLFPFKILQQIPKILFSIWYENRWLHKAVKQYGFDFVVSDNRYGFYHKNKPSFFITHQLHIQTPFPWLSKRLQNINYRFINRFKECWVPDFSFVPNLAGILSHPGQLPSIPVHYVGLMSRFSPQNRAKTKYKWLFIVSGPEPQRTIFEKLCCHAIAQLNDAVLLIRGLPKKANTLDVPKHCTMFNHLPTKGLQTAFAESEFIVSRAGYTTIMEIIALQKKSILIPTPGQTEQEYLAKHLVQQQWCFSCQQGHDLFDQMKKAETFPYQFPHLAASTLQDVVNSAILKKEFS
ncbi:MAG: glycosyl transferase family 28 [Bacteroidota bacterium]|nr:glycosyl transferase family 28 [Bacteroidota bacterium]